jgi:hypothetical protein
MNADPSLGNETVAQYQKAIESFGEFRRVWNLSGRDFRSVNEAHKRLKQLWYVLYRFRGLDTGDAAAVVDIRQLLALDPPGFYLRPLAFGIGVLLELHAEAFYFFAWRLRSVLRDIPGFGNFNPRGVCDVRNALIEHAEDSPRGVLEHSFEYNISEGIRLKPHGGGPGRVHDAGLYPNAKEFIEDLMRKLEVAENLLSVSSAQGEKE